MDSLSPIEIEHFTQILNLTESELFKMNPMAIRLLVSDAEMKLKFPDYQPALTEEQILIMFPSKER